MYTLTNMSMRMRAAPHTVIPMNTVMNMSPLQNMGMHTIHSILMMSRTAIRTIIPMTMSIRMSTRTRC